MGYNFLHSDSITNAGGVGVYIHDTISYRLRTDIPNSLHSSESIWIEVTAHKKQYAFGVIYRHPNNNINAFTESLNETLRYLSDLKVPFFVCGDVNINLLHHKIALPMRNYISTCTSYGCLQLITNPTRITPSSCTLIDHIYKNFPTEKLTPGILINHLSDHLPVFVFIKSKPLQKWKSKKYTKHDYSKFDSETFLTKVQETLNQLQIDQTKPSESLDLGILCLNRYLKEQVPVKQLTKSKK